MTDVVFFKKDNMICAYECSGHTGYGNRGYDIVCSALSSIIQSCALGLRDVVKAPIKIDRNDEEGYFKVVLLDNMSKDKRDKSQILLETLLLSVKDLAKNYSKYIKLEQTVVY